MLNGCVHVCDRTTVDLHIAIFKNPFRELGYSLMCQMNERTNGWMDGWQWMCVDGFSLITAQH